MKELAIVTDGVCDLTNEIIEKYGIETIPYRILFGQETYRVWHNDKFTISLEEFCSKLATTSKETLPRTSLPSPAEFKQAFDEALKSAQNVIAVLLTSGMSGAVQTAQMVVKNFYNNGNVTIFDSQQTMTGTGIQALEAAKMVADGKSKSEILNRLEALQLRVRTLLVMNDLDYLEKQGRLGPIENIRKKNPDLIPAIHMKDGILHPLTIFQNEDDLITRFENFAKKIAQQNETGDIFLTHINHQKVTKIIYDILVDSALDGTTIYYYPASAILGVYSGPHSIGLSYIGNFDSSWL
ncbi:MAG: DegV family protein [Candidatus Heimdallarchaeota archaeon]|nr:MAG: hypothetical protein DRO63_08075 [Candidatus Gerdarchaeota archaeon]RLI69445.1 MAG: hypothetical protein DRP02_10575 [Candidatus Gerdarchaeota archaeon]RLI70843.1 MAG: hypothetical protein DRO91_06315 [Candidatus Heimdallarchaeota archaeon]